MELLALLAPVLFFGAIIFFMSVKVLREYERGVVFRLGRAVGVRGPGLIILVPFIENMTKVELRTVTMDVPTQDVITKDNVSVKVNAVVYCRVMDPMKAVIEIEHYLYATSQLAQTTLRSVAGEVELDSLLSEREKLNDRLQHILDVETDVWGIKISKVELKHIDLPVEMQRAMAKQAEAERERRAKVIAAEGEAQAAARLTDAAATMSTQPFTMQLRFLQTLTEIAAENSSTVVLPIPIELLRAFHTMSERKD